LNSVSLPILNFYTQAYRESNGDILIGHAHGYNPFLDDQCAECFYQLDILNGCT